MRRKAIQPVSNTLPEALDRSLSSKIQETVILVAATFVWRAPL
jgi:hypothetical protein